MYFFAPFVMGTLKRFPHLQRLTMFIGLGILSLGLVASSFATKIWHLVLSQGLLYAIGGCMLYLPAVVLLDEWFIRKKGLAMGKLEVQIIPKSYPS